ncbi:hypothetical protein FI667_g11935, partial [Globisporangium splendens]
MPEQSPAKKGSFLPIVLGNKTHRKKAAYTKRGRSRSESHEKLLSSQPSTPSGDASDTEAPAKPSKKRSLSTSASERRSWNVLWVLFITAFLVCMVCLVMLGAMVQQNQLSNGNVDGEKPTFFGGVGKWRETQMFEKLKKLTSLFTSGDDATVNTQRARRELINLGEYECRAWRQTMNCTPDGLPESVNDQNCSTPIPNGISGYCEVQHKKTGEIKHVMEMHCDSLRPGVHFSCDMFQSLLSYHILSTDYMHDPNFSYEKNQDQFREINHLTNTPAPVGEDGFKNESVGQLELSFERGLVYVIYEKLLLGAYVSVRSLRALGCTLPIEMWFKRSETNIDHPLLKLMVAEYGVYLREITDPNATHFYTKLHAVFYSAFDNILLLDADNFAVRDPTYLFDTKEFQDTGAMFWPDFWKPGNTIFNIHEHSFVWEFFGLDYVDMFEQESGQILINRRKHLEALNVVMYYGFHLPRLHEELRLVWGDKDLFRFGWMKTNSEFYMIPRPPGSAGTKHTDYDLFCGVTMVQHDPSGRVIFLHRNTEKLTHLNDRLLWTHIQQYKRTSPLTEYFVRGANGGKVFPQFKRCFGKDVHYEKLFTLKPLSAFPFEHLEQTLLQYSREGAAILNVPTAFGAAHDDGLGRRAET